MAFKNMSSATHAERVQNQQEALQRSHDHRDFQNEEPKEHVVFIRETPVLDPVSRFAVFGASDGEKRVSLSLRGDRCPESMFEPGIEALSKALMHGRDRDGDAFKGVPAVVQGVRANVGFGADLDRNPKGKFENIFVETMAINIDGQRHVFGRDRIPPLEAPAKVGQVSRETVAPMPTHSGAPSAGQIQAAQAAEDASLFGNRDSRAMALQVSDSNLRRRENGDMEMDASNARGPVTLVLPGRRGQSFEKSEARAFLDAQCANGTSVEIQARGIFKSRDAGLGKPRQWDFVVEEGAFKDASGRSHAIGAVRQSAPLAQEGSQVVAMPVARSRNRSSGMER